MIVTVQGIRRDGEEVVATVPDGAATAEFRFSGEDAASVALQWERSEFDRGRYAAFPPEFPTPAGIPIELPDRVAAPAP
ncbi:MAG TPA: hypothetical protein VGO13_08060 [Solirubrobacterales bacterium]|nr:hypothetical protein [Solirubrobacterales bacterium]